MVPFLADKEEEAIAANTHTDRHSELSFSTETSRLDSELTEASIALCDPDSKRQKSYLRTNKETFDAELYGILEALGMTLKKGRVGQGASRQ